MSKMTNDKMLQQNISQLKVTDDERSAKKNESDVMKKTSTSDVGGKAEWLEFHFQIHNFVFLSLLLFDNDPFNFIALLIFVYLFFLFGGFNLNPFFIYLIFVLNILFHFIFYFSHLLICITCMRNWGRYFWVMDKVLKKFVWIYWFGNQSKGIK